MGERSVTFRSAGLDLAGTFTWASAERSAAVLMLPGSGQTDRNDNAKRLAINACPPLVEALGRIGVATFRYDKRGVDASEGDYWRTGFDDRLTDALAAVDWLCSRPEVDPTRVFVLGHSEGALIAVRIAARPVPVAGVILLAGAAKSGEQTLRWQGRQIAASLTGATALLVKALRIDPQRAQDKSIARIKASSSDTMRMQLVQKVNVRWMREFLAYDPAPDLARIHVPVLAITGTKDIQVDPVDVDRVTELVPGPVEAHRVPDVTHLLRSEPGAPSLKTYKRQASEPVDARVIDLVRTWLKGHIDGPRG